MSSITTLTTSISITTTKNIGGFIIDQINVTPFTSAVVIISLYDASNNFITNSNVTLTGADYTNWGNNDQYIITYIENKIPTLAI